MEKKNAEKKLSIQKRDRKIRELEEIIKIKDGELDNKNALIFELQKKNGLLSKFKASLKPIGKVPEIVNGNPDFLKAKNLQPTTGVGDIFRNISEEVVMVDDLPDDPSSGETDPVSEFLALIAQVKGLTGDEGHSQQEKSNSSKNNEEISDIVEIENDVVIQINEKDVNDAIATISSDDEIHLVNEAEENILIPTLEHHSSFSLEGIVDPFLRLKPFASMCAKSQNIVGRESKKRKVFQSSFTSSEGFQSKPNKQAKLSQFQITN